MPEAIFRRLDDPMMMGGVDVETDDEYQAEPIVEMNSSDSYNTGTTVSERTTVTVHRNKPLPEFPDLVPEEEEAAATAAAVSPRPTMTKGEDPSSSSHRTSLTSPVTPDTSIDGGTDALTLSSGISSEKPDPEDAEGIPSTKQAFDDDKAEKEDGRNAGDKEDERDMKTPSPVSKAEAAASSGSNSRRSHNSSSERNSRVASRRSTRSRVASRRGSLRDEDSSSDESSYFAQNLPDPKSSRSFSMSSAASNGSAFSNPYQKHGSDASLSFSDESDEEHHHHHHHSRHGSGNVGVHISPVVNPKRSVADMNLYPQRITRMHSVSSLVSSASSDNHVDGEISGDEEGVNRRRSFTGDDSITSSLPSISSTGPAGLDPSGGYYVHQIHHNYHPQSYMGSHSHSPQIQYYSQNHPPLTNQQMMAWATNPPSDGEFEYTSSEYTTSSRNNSDAHPQHRSHQYGQSYGSTSLDVQRNLKSASSGSLKYPFSDDDEPNPLSLFSSSAAMGKQAAGGPGGGVGGRNAFNGGLGAPGGNPRAGGGDSKIGNGADAKPAAVATGQAAEDAGALASPGGGTGKQTFRIYWQRWIMLFYMSVLNLLSDWTCYSVAPISLLTEEAFGSIDPERLVVVFLGANAVASACEPMILARLGLRHTVLLGSLLLMIGSIIKSGGLPPLMEPSLQVGNAQMELYMGFFIVGLSQPLYQCTPALLSASWFPEEERTMATGVALNANQLGIGFAFIFGTLLVSMKDDIIPYFGLLSQVSTLCFIGALLQFDDAPPTPPSASARVMKGNLNFTMPAFADQRIRQYFAGSGGGDKKESAAQAPTPASSPSKSKPKQQRSSKTKKPASSTSKRGSARRRGSKFQAQTANAENGLMAAAPSSAPSYGSTAEAKREATRLRAEAGSLAHAPSLAPADSEADPNNSNESSHPDGLPPGAYPPPGQMPPGYYPYPPANYQYFQQMQAMQQQMYQQQMYYQQQQMHQATGAPTGGQQQQQQPPMPPMPPQMQYFPPPQPMAVPPYPYQPQQQPQPQFYEPQPSVYGMRGSILSYDDYDIDTGADGLEPIVTVTDHHLDIDIKDDQVVRSLHACMIRQGFSHALAAFTVSGIVINTLSTYMDYLVRLNGAPRSYTGIVGGAFQFAIMASSLIMGKQTDKTRAYYSVTTGMLVLGAFGLAECGVSLDSNRGGDLRWSLLLVAVLVGPLQPISTELGVEVAYPLSENTVLVIQQLFSNLLSALFIPFFKSLKDIGTTVVRGGEMIERPEYTFSFYLLIVLHTLVTVYFATFNGRYLRYEHELQKKEEDEKAEEDAEWAQQRQQLAGEYAPLLNPNIGTAVR